MDVRYLLFLLLECSQRGRFDIDSRSDTNEDNSPDRINHSGMMRVVLAVTVLAQLACSVQGKVNTMMSHDSIVFKWPMLAMNA